MPNGRPKVGSDVANIGTKVDEDGLPIDGSKCKSSICYLYSMKETLPYAFLVL